MDLAHDPSLDSHNVRWRWDLGWSSILKPGVCETVEHQLRLTPIHVQHTVQRTLWDS